MNSRILTILIFTTAIVYLFATAPAQLPDDDAELNGATSGATMMDIETALEIIANENEIARSIYTKQIVGPGLKAGLAFDEDWKKPEVHAGPLPALFLRETAKNLHASGKPLGLFLGSDYPIEAANLFSGPQADAFARIRAGDGTQHFVEPETGLRTAMFADVAMAQPCVSCHNEHPNSPKSDWQLGDVMGATTWTYPKARISETELLELLRALRQAIRDAYMGLLEESQHWDDPPVIGERWPEEGRFLPDADAFLTAINHRSSGQTLAFLLSHGGPLDG